MGESTSRRSRSRSPSHRREREHKPHKSRHHNSHRDDRSDEEDDRRHRHSKHKHRRDETEEERKERKKAKKEKRRKDEGGPDEEEDLWVEKGADDAADAAAAVPTSDALSLRSNPSDPKAVLPHDTATGSQTRERDSWMLDPGPLAGSSSIAAIATQSGDAAPRSAGTTTTAAVASSGSDDFFSGLGTVHERKNLNDLKELQETKVDKRELNRQLVEGKKLEEYAEMEEKEVVKGGPGWQWRMMKLRKLFEQAEEQGRDAEDVALERYGNIEDFQAALAERSYLDERDKRRQSRQGRPGGGGQNTPGGSSAGMRTPETGSAGRRFMFTSSDDGPGSRPGSRAGFRRPGEEREVATPNAVPGAGRVDELRRRESGRVVPQTGTPIPNVFTPTALNRQSSGFPFSTPPAAVPPAQDTTSKPPLSTADLNKLQARVLRAKLSDDPQAEKLEEEYERELERSERGGTAEAGMWAGGSDGVQGQLGRDGGGGAGHRVETQVLPTLDGRGRLYDVGQGKEDGASVMPGNRRKKPEKFETRDREGNLLRYNADDDEQTLGELVRQERFGAGSADQKNLDAEMAQAIARDGKYEDDLDYMDDNADKLARKKMKTDAMKRAFAINDYARTKKALDSCPFCYQDDRNPLTAIVALGRRTYMCCTTTEELVPGHCLIVPIQHCLSSLEMEDDDWDEVRNFMKCLMRMHAKDNKGVLFYETVLSFKQQRHTYIEAVPVPLDQFQDAPAYFRESILASESEWTQHKKLIDFSTRPGGFRRMLVSNLPYFMVQWDYKGEKGYGHVIEGVDDAAGRGEGEDDMGVGMDEGDKGGGEFPKYFAAEIIGNLLGLEPRKWRKPRRMDFALNKERARKLGEWFQPYNWTVQLQEG